MEIALDTDNSGLAKRRKVGTGELRLSSSKPVRVIGREDGINTSKNLSDSAEKEDLSGLYTDEMSFCSGDIPASCCSSNGSVMEKLKCSDLKERAVTETTVRDHLNRRESTPTSDFKEESGDLESMTKEKQPELVVSRCRIPSEKTPPAAELEEFFAAAEKDLQKRFKDRYNYDIVKDVPLKGRFEWVQLKP